MLDERTTCLLNVINEKCSLGSYKVISIDELIEDFPPQYMPDNDLIRQMINALASGGYISLKFDRDDDFCLCPTPKGREYFEIEKQTGSVKKINTSRLLNYFYNFLCVTLGVFFAVLLLKLFGVIC